MRPSHPSPFFRIIFHKYFTCFNFKNLLRKYKPSTLKNGIIYYVSFLCKSNIFLELVKATCFSVLFTFLISAMRLFIFMNLVSLDLYTHNLNIRRMEFIKTLLFLKRSYCLWNQEPPK